MMDLKANRVIDIQLVQVNNYTIKTFCYVNYYILCIDLSICLCLQSNEVGNSQRMEKEGFERSLSLLEERGVVVQSLVTDRHTGVQKFMREQKKDIRHFFDPWHMGKG